MGIDLTNTNTTEDSAGTDFIYARKVQGDPNRGIYMQSPFYHGRYFAYSYQAPGESFVGPQPYILAAENDLIKAEALIRTGGDRTAAAALVNNTRVTRGGLTALVAADNDATFMAAITYEREVELVATDGFGFFALRHMDQLQPGTVRHLPVPAAELQTDNIPVYTFGGAVENPTGLNVVPTNAGKQFSADLARYEAGPWRNLALPSGQVMQLPTPLAIPRPTTPAPATKY
jgi:starch-binding outer membrane protein, SusD/RagB family